MSRPFQHRIKKQVEPRSDYGGRIGAPPGTMFTMDFKDSDRDGVDDRHQPGPGMPDPRWKGRKPAPPRREGPKFGDRNDPRRDRLEKALQDRKRRELLTGGKRPPKGVGGGSPDWLRRSPKPPRRGKTVKGSRPRPPMPSPKPPMFGGGRPKPPMGGGRPPRGGTIGGTIGAIGGAIGGRPPRGGGRPPMFGGGRPKPPRGGRTVKGSRPRPPMPSPKPPGRVPITLGGIR
jgi:hypothetical protein